MSADIDTKPLDALIKILKEKQPVACVGILEAKGKRKKSRLEGGSNAEIGAKHEFGQDGMPIRSFLRVPLTENFQRSAENLGALEENVVKRILDEKSLTSYIKKLGVIGVGIVLDAFKSGGFGKWKPSNMELKKVKQTLVETQQLRDSISYEVRTK